MKRFILLSLRWLAIPMAIGVAFLIVGAGISRADTPSKSKQAISPVKGVLASPIGPVALNPQPLPPRYGWALPYLFPPKNPPVPPRFIPKPIPPTINVNRGVLSNMMK